MCAHITTLTVVKAKSAARVIRSADRDKPHSSIRCVQSIKKGKGQGATREKCNVMAGRLVLDMSGDEKGHSGSLLG